jgi:hypothetical protein
VAFFGCVSGSAASVHTQRVDYAKAPVAGLNDFYAAQGFRMSASCAAGPDLGFEAETISVPEAVMGWNMQRPGAAEAEFNGDFGDPAEQDLLTSFGTLGDHNAGGQAIVAYAGSSNFHTVDWAAFEGGLQEPGKCQVAGVSHWTYPSEDTGPNGRLDYRAQQNTGTETVLRRAGLRLNGSCEGGTTEIVASSTKPNATIHVNSQSVGDVADYAEDDDFDPGDTLELDSEGITLDATTGQIVYATRSGRVLSIDFLADQDSFTPVIDCVFLGTTRSLGKRSKATVSYRSKTKNGRKVFFKRGGVKLSASCAQATGLDVFVGSRKARGFVSANQNASGPTALAGTAAGGGANTIVLNGESASGHTIVVLANGKILTVDWLADEQDALAGADDCALIGTSEFSKP